MENEFSGNVLLRVADDIAKFGVADAAIAELKEKFAPLQIAGVDDLQGFEAVKRARLEVRKYRTRIEEVRKALKADSLEYGRRVDGEAKRLTALILEVEGGLQAKETAIEQERLRIAQEAQRALEARRAQRIEQARASGIEWDGGGFSSRYSPARLSQQEIDSLDDSNFALLLQGAAAAKQEAEAVARAAEEERRAAEQAEQERLRAERQRLEQEQASLQAERARMEAERAELAALRAKVAAAEQPAAAPQQAQEARSATPTAFPWEAPAAPVQEARSATPAAFPWEAPAAAGEALQTATGWLELWARCPCCGEKLQVPEFEINFGQPFANHAACKCCGAAVVVNCAI
jgi:DNA polymerase III gamma/tau subunit